MLEQHHTQAEVAEALRVSLRTVKRLCAGPDPRLPTVTIGRAVRVPASAVSNFLRASQRHLQEDSNGR